MRILPKTLKEAVEVICNILKQIKSPLDEIIII